MPAPKCNQNAKGNRGGTGRPPVYTARIPGIVCGLRERGATGHEIANVLGISDRTLRRWAAERIEFSSALSVSNEAVVNRARQSLFERAAGYSFETEREDFPIPRRNYPRQNHRALARRVRRGGQAGFPEAWRAIPSGPLVPLSRDFGRQEGQKCPTTN
jgi:hypothetical protein